jgi:hypothetical protein
LESGNVIAATKSIMTKKKVLVFMTDQTPTLTCCEPFIEEGRMLASIDRIIIDHDSVHKITELEGFMSTVMQKLQL